MRWESTTLSLGDRICQTLFRRPAMILCPDWESITWNWLACSNGKSKTWIAGCWATASATLNPSNSTALTNAASRIAMIVLDIGFSPCDRIYTSTGYFGITL
jgi:hypothetical protein